ncbi:MAG: phosphoserine phosphatase SerB [Succinivibrio sp.]|nr:phosphoserine phosphatase SerB [Succinivibrio sp.]
MSYVFLVKKDPAFDVVQAGQMLETKSGTPLRFIRSGELNGNRGGLFLLPDAEAKDSIRAPVLEKCFDFDVLITDTLPSLKRRGELVLDMDMTSVQIEGIDEIARRLGVYDEVADITSQAMHGGLDFASSLKKRVSLLKDGDASVIEDVRKIMKETDGLDVLMEITAKAGWQRGICSGGFVQLICVLEQKYHLQMVCANSLEIVDGRLTGRVDREIVDAEVKRRGVVDLREREHIDKEQVIVLGDGANDLKMIAEAGLGIAYHAKPLVQKEAPCCINHSDLAAVALLLTLGDEKA